MSWQAELVGHTSTQAALTAAHGGHSSGVQAMITISQPHQFLISADWEGNMKVPLPAAGR